MKTAFVTGGTGLLGSNLVRQLVREGYEVRALVRSREKAERFLGDVPVQFVLGDLDNIAAFAPELEPCDVLFHTAAYFREYYGAGDHEKTLERLNVQASVELFEEAAKRGVRRGVFTSSSGTVGKQPDGSAGDETTSPAPIATTNRYFGSKVRAEAALNKLSKRLDMDIIHILPGLMIGPGDAAPTAAGQLILDFVEGKLPAVLEGGSSTVDARDVAAAMVKAAERGVAGERYIVAGQHHSVADIIGTLSSITGVPAPKRTLHYPLSLGIAWLAETTARLRGSEPQLTVVAVKAMNANLQVTSKKAVRDLGATFRPLEETLRDEVAWFEAHGYFRATTQILSSSSSAGSPLG